MFFQVDVISSFDFTVKIIQFCTSHNYIVSSVVLHILFFFSVYTKRDFGYEKTFFTFEIINI